jgi:glyoxylase-like metal-dependent hydrolase (beta-lactamase superfamily II)
MGTIDKEAGTRVDEISAGIYRLSTPVPPTAMPGGFTFNQYLLLDEEPLLFQTGPRRLFPLTRAAIAHVMPIERLRWIAFSHVESDECGALNDLLAVAPHAAPVCSRVGAAVSVIDLADRPPRALADGETLVLGGKRVTWFDTPHLPHGWDSGLMLEETTRTLLCGDLFTQGGHQPAPITEGDILEPSMRFQKPMDYWAYAPDTRLQIERLAATCPTTLACMHGSAFRGDGADLLRQLADAVLAPNL